MFLDQSLVNISIAGIFTLFILYITSCIVVRRKLFNTFQNLGIPGPNPSLLSGNAFRYLSDPIGMLTKWKKEYGDIFGFYYGPRPFLVVSDRDVMKTVLKERFDNFTNRPKMVVPIEPIASGVVQAENPMWSTLRKPLTCALTGSKIKLMGDSINSSIDEFLKVVDEASGEPFDIYKYCQGLTMNVIGKCALAMEINCLRNPKELILQSTREFMANGINGAVKLAIMFPSLANVMVFLYNRLTAGKFSDVVCNHLTRILAYRRRLEGPKRLDMLQMLIDATDSEGRRLTEKEIIGSCFSFVIAGYETTSNNLSYTFYLLAKHPEIQQALFEQVQFLGDRPTDDDLNQCPLLNQVIQESLRMYPPVVTFVMRRASETIDLAGYSIPAGTSIMIPVYQLHHDENLWENPERFDPSRFSPENTRVAPMSFLPFGDGRRNCLGKRFAMFEVKLTVARTVSMFQLSLCSKSESPLEITVPTVTANPKNGVILTAVARTSD